MCAVKNQKKYTIIQVYKVYSIHYTVYSVHGYSIQCVKGTVYRVQGYKGIRVYSIQGTKGSGKRVYNVEDLARWAQALRIQYY